MTTPKFFHGERVAFVHEGQRVGGNAFSANPEAVHVTDDEGRNYYFVPVTDLLSLEKAALDAIAQAYNSSSATPQDIVNAVASALRDAGYDLKY